MPERVDMMRNTNNNESGHAIWEVFYPKTVDDAVYLTNENYDSDEINIYFGDYKIIITDGQTIEQGTISKIQYATI